jgi:hypothetical protein
MKLALAASVYLVIALVLGLGILLTIAGKPWPLITAFVAFGRNLLGAATLTTLHKMVRRDELRESQTQFIQVLVELAPPEG